MLRSMTAAATAKILFALSDNGYVILVIIMPGVALWLPEALGYWVAP